MRIWGKVCVGGTSRRMVCMVCLRKRVRFVSLGGSKVLGLRLGGWGEGELVLEMGCGGEGRGEVSLPF